MGVRQVDAGHIPRMGPFPTLCTVEVAEVDVAAAYVKGVLY